MHYHEKHSTSASKQPFYLLFGISCIDFLKVLLQYVHTGFFPHDVIKFLKYIYPAEKKTPTNQTNKNKTYHNSVLPLLLQDGVLNLVSFCPFPFKCSSNLSNQKLQFSFIKLQDMSPQHKVPESI